MDNIFYVSYSYSQDLNNYIRQLRNNTKYQYGMDVLEMSKKYFPEEFLLPVINAASNTHAESLVLNYWRKIRDKNFDDVVTKKVEEFNQSLYNNQSQIINTLEDIYKNKFPFLNKINIFLTTFYRCPYNYPNWFMSYVDCNNEKLKEVTLHEMNHFMFYYYWQKKLKTKINEKQLECLKEALAVLTSSDPDNENRYKPEVLPIQNIVKENKDKPIREVINLVIKSGVLSDNGK